MSGREQLGRMRWAVRGTLALGVAASVAANVLHAQPNPVSQTIAGWPPLALLVTIELISRVPVHRRGLAAVRLGAAAVLAGIAAWVSYWHMVAVVARYGETGAAPYLIPVSVDGLVVVASVCLVELAGRIRTAEQAAAVAVAVVDGPPADVPAVVPAQRVRGRRRGEAAEAVARVLAERPDMSASEVAEAAAVSERHARRLLRGLAALAQGSKQADRPVAAGYGKVQNSSA